MKVKVQKLSSEIQRKVDGAGPPRRAAGAARNKAQYAGDIQYNVILLNIHEGVYWYWKISILEV